MQIKLFTIPNLLTLSNLVCGSFAVISTLVWGRIDWAFWLIIVAAVFDFFDGFVARLLKSSSPIGVELDSLADMISFGFAPAAMLFVLWNEVAPDNLWLLYGGNFLCFVMAAFAALRLAKFNIDETQHTEFCGLPTPANCLFFASLAFISYHSELRFPPQLILFAPVMSWLMVSNIRMFALKFHGFGWRGNEIRYGFLIAAVVLIAALRIYAVPLVILLYILISVVRHFAGTKGREKA